MSLSNVNHVAAFEKLLGVCNELGARYKPNKVSLKPAALATLFQQAQQSSEAAKEAHANFIKAVKTRKSVYDELPALASRVVRAAIASDGSEDLLNSIKAFNRAMHYPAKKKSSMTPVSDQSEAAPVKTRSVSRLGFEGKAENFTMLVKLVQRIAEYAPEETELSVAALNAKIVELRTLSSAVIQTTNTLANARQQRDKVFYGTGGLHETGTLVKEYIRSTTGVRAPKAKELAQVRLANKKMS